MTWQEKFESQFRWERRGGKNVRVRISDNTIISDKEYVKLYKTAQSDTATQRRESFGKEQFLDQFIWSDKSGPGGKLQTRRQAKELNKSRLPLTINLKGGGTRTIHPSHPEYNKYKSGELKINNEFRLPGEDRSPIKIDLEGGGTRTIYPNHPEYLRYKTGMKPLPNKFTLPGSTVPSDVSPNESLAINPTGPTAYDAKAAGGLQAWYRGGPRTLKQARADSNAYFIQEGWLDAKNPKNSVLPYKNKRLMNEISREFRAGRATVFTNKGGKDFLHYKGQVYQKPTKGG